MTDNDLPLLKYIASQKHYPDRAGHKEPTTSKDAADRIEDSGRADLLRNRCLAAIGYSDIGMTAKDCAEFLREDLNSVRPRLTELKQRNLIKCSGLRRLNQHVLVLK